MTPFGDRLRQLRRRNGVTQKEMAREIGVSAAYLSALEHGRKGVASWATLQKIIGYFNVIWDEADELERLALQSRPKVTIDTAGLSPEATRLANLLADRFPELSAEEMDAIRQTLEFGRSGALTETTGPSAAKARPACR